MIALVRPTSAALWEEAARLVDEYAASLDVALDFQNFAHERAHLAEEYGPPHGAFLLAQDAGVPGRPLTAVLDDTPPKPGRRPMR